MDGRRTMTLGMILALAGGAAMAGGTAHATQEGDPIPPWIKTVFGYYVDGDIGDSEIINALQHLIDIGVITMPAGGDGEPAAYERAPPPAGRNPPAGGGTAEAAKAAYERAAAERAAAERAAAERAAAAAYEKAVAAERAAAEHANNRTARAAELKAAWEQYIRAVVEIPRHEQMWRVDTNAIFPRHLTVKDMGFEEAVMRAAAGNFYYQAAGGEQLNRAATYEKAAANWEAARAAAEWMYEAGNPDPPHCPDICTDPRDYVINEIDYWIISYAPHIVKESPDGKEISAYTNAAQTWAAAGDDGRAAAAYEKAAAAAARADISAWTLLDTALTKAGGGSEQHWRYMQTSPIGVDFKLRAADIYEQAAEAWTAAGDDGRAAAAYEKAAAAIAP